jgi:spore maturation protein CgeB
MTVLIVGQFGPSQLGGSFSSAFRALGHDVVEIDPLAGLGPMGSRIASGLAGNLAAQAMRRRIGRRFLSRLRKASLVLVLKGQYLQPAFLDELRRETGGQLINFNPDDPFNLNGSSSDADIVEAIPSFDLYLTWSMALIEPIRKAGARRVEFLPFAVDIDQFHPVQLTDSERRMRESPLCFVGNWDEEREPWLEAVADFGLALWGNCWNRARSSLLRKCWRGGAVYGEELLRTIAAGQVHLNVLRRQNKAGHNMRTFELPACGAFQLTERSPDLPLLFAEGLEVAAFSSLRELREKTSYYLVHPVGCNQIAERGRARALTQTYTVRAERIIDLVTCSKPDAEASREASGSTKLASVASVE